MFSTSLTRLNSIQLLLLPRAEIRSTNWLDYYSPRMHCSSLICSPTASRSKHPDILKRKCMYFFFFVSILVFTWIIRYFMICQKIFFLFTVIRAFIYFYLFIYLFFLFIYFYFYIFNVLRYISIDFYNKLPPSYCRPSLFEFLFIFCFVFNIFNV